jgi:hypothetical protein
MSIAIALSLTGRHPNNTGATRPEGVVGAAVNGTAGVTPDAAGAGADATASGTTAAPGIKPAAAPGVGKVNDVENDVPGEPTGACAMQASDNPKPQKSTRPERIQNR